jgi:hypothetical protein
MAKEARAGRWMEFINPLKAAQRTHIPHLVWWIVWSLLAALCPTTVAATTRSQSVTRRRGGWWCGRFIARRWCLQLRTLAWRRKGRRLWLVF